MKFTIKRDKRTNIEKSVDCHLETLADGAQKLEDLQQITEIMERQEKLREKKRISPDTIAVIAGNLLGIALIIGHEQLGHVISTKALGFVLKGRV